MEQGAGNELVEHGQGAGGSGLGARTSPSFSPLN